MNGPETTMASRFEAENPDGRNAFIEVSDTAMTAAQEHAVENGTDMQSALSEVVSQIMSGRLYDDGVKGDYGDDA